jgi:hypothetical protein
MEMNMTYTCDEMKPIKAGQEFVRYNRRGEIDYINMIETSKDAAREFANRIARKVFGRRGYCHHVRLDSWKADGSYANYEAFIGVAAQGGGTNGRNVWLTVYSK